MRITGFTLIGNEVRIEFRGVAGKHYSLERNSALSSSNWSEVAPFVGVAGLLDLIDPAGRRGTSQYYRVRLLP
jgi:hypothetical protein